MLAITQATIAATLEPFGLQLSPDQLARIETYLELLLRWNRHLNLTAIRDPETIVARHFGESLYVARILDLDERLLVDVGTGAGFPGLAIKIIVPTLRVVLIESVGKKVVFLKEVIRALSAADVEVVKSRFEDVVSHWQRELADIVTARGVGDHRALVRAATLVLCSGGTMVFYLGRRDAESLVRDETSLRWQECRLLPGARERVILLGTKE